MILAGLAILLIAKPAFPESSVIEELLDPSLEAFREPGGDTYRFPPRYLWENSQYDFSLLIPEGAEGCSKASIMSSHGGVFGPSDMPCRDVLNHGPIGIYASYSSASYDHKTKRALIRENCKKHHVNTTNIVVDGHSFLKCWGQMDYGDDKRRYMDYFTFSKPNPGLELHVYIFCPTSGNCNQWLRKWEKLIFDNLHINW
jgi:hypothetical protein